MYSRAALGFLASLAALLLFVTIDTPWWLIVLSLLPLAICAFALVVRQFPPLGLAIYAWAMNRVAERLSK